MKQIMRLPGLLVLLAGAFYAPHVFGFVWTTLYTDQIATSALYAYAPASPREFLAVALGILMFAGIARGIIALIEDRVATWAIFVLTTIVFGIAWYVLAPLPEAIFLTPNTLVGDDVNQGLAWFNFHLPSHQFDVMALVVAAMFMAAVAMIAVVLDRMAQRGVLLAVKVVRKPVRSESGNGYVDELRPSGAR